MFFMAVVLILHQMYHWQCIMLKHSGSICAASNGKLWGMEKRLLNEEGDRGYKQVDRISD